MPPADPARATIVIPCFDEARRLPRDGVLALTHSADVLLVDSGSTDGTPALLAELAADSPHVRALTLARNRGKGEAVRHGLLAALDTGAQRLAYFDADFATPGEEMLRLLDLLDRSPDTSVLLASRVALLGRDIRRSASRHYLGRVYATVASLALDLPVYDTQCGAKALRRTPALEAALARPFRTRWAFDVELLGRLLATPGFRSEEIVEEPLRAWADVAGGRLIPWEMARALGEILALWRALAQDRARGWSS
ncbi:glycosyltransferase [Conexibacter sp. W3-3-2]|uniref:glycosyltransferase n=1 Tax=Conexibacter sp. W3-3-2 TaxID=2675227 RepID=UPI0012BA2BB3|nr:glycosyltransferase [Conexibacter sp. W3-3-2]MTD46250.1 glycosyltransferase [Conexibacter sp. W3-3-2]